MRLVLIGMWETGWNPVDAKLRGATAGGSWRNCTHEHLDSQRSFSLTCCRSPSLSTKWWDCRVSAFKAKLSFWPLAISHHTQQSGDALTTQERPETLKGRGAYCVGQSSPFLQLQMKAFLGPGLSCCGVSGKLLNPSLSFPFNKMRTRFHATPLQACSQRHCLQQPESRKSSNVHQLRNGKAKHWSWSMTWP